MADRCDISKRSQTAIQAPCFDDLLLLRAEAAARERGVNIDDIINDALNRYFSVSVGDRIRASWLTVLGAAGAWGAILALSVLGPSIASAIEKTLSQKAAHEEARAPGTARLTDPPYQ